MYADDTVKSFLAQTAAHQPTPGGGSVAALTGAMGVALLEMVVSYTVDNKKCRAVRERVLPLRAELADYHAGFLELMEEDMRAYQHFTEVRALPRRTEEEKAHRRSMMAEALKQAADVPLRTVQACERTLLLAETLLNVGNPNLVSDIGVGACLLGAALEGAALNVRVNLTHIRDSEYTSRVRWELSGIMERALARKRGVAEECADRVSS